MAEEKKKKSGSKGTAKTARSSKAAAKAAREAAPAADTPTKVEVVNDSPAGKLAAGSDDKPVKVVIVNKSRDKKAEKTENKDKGTFLSKFLWFVSFLLIAAAILGNYYYVQYVAVGETVTGRLLRVGAVVATIAAGLGVSLFTIKGRQFLVFLRESYVELRKVVWPTRQEAFQTTFIIFIAVCVVSLFLYLCDVVFLQIVKAITL